MEEDEFVASGTVQTGFDVWSFSQFLSRSGIPAEVRESSHFQSGEYVSVRKGETRVTAEKIEASTFLLRGEGTGGKELSSVCKALSVVLAAANIEHRIELYDGEDRLRHEHIYPPVA